jgi:hypothetical protein
MSSCLRASVVALLVLTACGGRSASENAAPEKAAVLQVENQGFTDMVIYAYGTGGRHVWASRPATRPNLLISQHTSSAVLARSASWPIRLAPREDP